MKKIERILQDAERHCSEKGTRLTTKRKEILTGLLEAGRALSAYELIDFCKTEYDTSIPAMTVYRILDFLQEEQLVHKLSLANKFVACSHISCDHEHEIPQFLICTECQKVEEIVISASVIRKLQGNVEEAGFHLVSPQLEMNCLCKKCFKAVGSS